jgi:pimeloyl-ACP methyl ester carboxylesterase
MPKARVNGIDLFYQDVGPPTAPALCLVMGWGGDHTAWALQIPAFAAHYRVIAFDNRGAGQSDAPDVPYTIAGMADDALGLLEALGISAAHVCGASMGGMIAQEMALRQPARVLTLQLHCTLARPDAYGAFLVAGLLRVRGREDPEEFARAIVPWLFCRTTLAQHPELVDFFIARALEYPHPTGLVGLTRQAHAIGSHDTLDRLARIRVPTLITVGAGDILVPPPFSREIHAQIATSELVEIADAGHLHFMEQFERFNEICLGFLAKAADGA